MHTEHIEFFYILCLNALNSFESLTQVINLFQLKICIKNNTGADLGLATPLTLVFFIDKNSIYEDTEHLYSHINQEIFNMRSPLRLSVRRESNERRMCTGDEELQMRCSQDICQ